DRLTGAFRLLQRRRAGRITWLVRGIAGGTGRGRRLSRGTTLLGRGSPVGRSAARSICSRPVLLSRSRPAWPVRQGRSSGGSGVIWSAGYPRAHTIPGSLVAAVGGRCPHPRIRKLTPYPMCPPQVQQRGVRGGH